MKKKFRSIIAIALCSFWTVFLTACKSELAKPEEFKFDITTQTLSWDKVEGATGYTIEVDGEIVTTRANYLSLEDLDTGIYDVKVKANGDGKDITDSKWAVYEDFERVAETGLVYKLINNDTEYELVGVGTAKGDVVMENVFRGKPVTGISANALRNNRLTSFIIGENVKTIGKSAFQNSQSLVELVIPEGVTSVGEGLIQGSKKLEKLTLPQAVKEIPQALATNCTQLKEVVVSNTLTAIGASAFSYCDSLTSFIFPDSVKTVEENAFFRCANLTEMAFGQDLEYIGKNAFSKCEKLATLTFGEKLEYIDEYAFYECLSLTTLTLPDSVKYIGGRAFFECEKLATIDLGDGLESMGVYAFFNTKAFNDAPDGKDTANEGLVIIDGWLVACKNEKISTVVNSSIVGVADYAFVGDYAMLNAVDLSSVKYIGGGAFFGCPALAVAHFGNSLLKIGNEAFATCKALRDVQLGNSLTHIGDYAFTDCTAFSTLALPDTVERIGTYAFNGTGFVDDEYGVVYLSNATGDSFWIVGIGDMYASNPVIKEGTKGIANYSFVDCSMLGNVILPDSLEYIGVGAFNGCGMADFMSINIPKNLKVIDDYAFYDCPLLWLRDEEGEIAHNFKGSAKLEKIGRSAFYNCAILGADEFGIDENYYVTWESGSLDLTGVNEIGEYAFFSNWGIKSLVLGTGVEKVGSRAFNSCPDLQTVTVGPTVTEMGTRVFYNCTALERVVIGTGLKAIPDYTFYGCTKLSSVAFATGGGVEHIGKYAFRGCEALASINFGDSLKSIDNYAFFNCGFTEIVIPDTVQSVGNYAFRGCKNVTSILLPDTLTTIGKHAFYSLNNATVYTENATLPAYWSEYWNTSYRPVVWGVTFSEDNTYVVSFVKNAESMNNPVALNGIMAPTRYGYTFAGWATAEGSTEVAYAAADIASAPDGTALYAIWTAIN